MNKQSETNEMNFFYLFQSLLLNSIQKKDANCVIVVCCSCRQKGIEKKRIFLLYSIQLTNKQTNNFQIVQENGYERIDKKWLVFFTSSSSLNDIWPWK